MDQDLNQDLESYGLLTNFVRRGPPISEEDLQQVEEKVHSLYESGTPFFTKETFRRMADEFARASEENTTRVISLTGLDGVIVDFEVKIETADMAIQEGREYFAQGAQLHYLPAQHIIAFSKNDPTNAYCSIQIMHRIVKLSSIQSLTKNSIQGARNEVDELLRHCQQAWEASEQCKEFKKLLVQQAGLRRVTKIIGIGLGALSGTGIETSAANSAHQHALLQTLQEFLMKSQTQAHIPCYVQDPAYAIVDKAALHDTGFTVLEDPSGFVEVDDDSAVVSFYPDIPVKEIVFDLAKPALIIWRTVRDRQFETSSSDEQPPVLSADPDGPRVRAAIRTDYDELGFPGHEQFSHDASIYIKRTNDPPKSP